MVRLHRPTVSSLPRRTPRRLSPWQRPTPERSYPASLSFSHPPLAFSVCPTHTYTLYLCALLALATSLIPSDAWTCPSSSFSRARTRSFLSFSCSLPSRSPYRNLQHTDIACLSHEFSSFLSPSPQHPCAFLLSLVGIPALEFLLVDRAIRSESRRTIGHYQQPASVLFLPRASGGIIAKITKPLYVHSRTRAHSYPASPHCILVRLAAGSCYVLRLPTRKASMFLGDELACHAFHPLFYPDFVLSRSAPCPSLFPPFRRKRGETNVCC